MQGPLTAAAELLKKTCSEDAGEIEEAHSATLQAIKSSKVVEKVVEFDNQKEGKAFMVSLRQYMEMMQIIMFIRPVTSGDWKLHLPALKSLTPHFFALDKADVHVDDSTVPHWNEAGGWDWSWIYEEFKAGNSVVSKSDQVPLCAVGVDHALEHQVRLCAVGAGHALEHISHSMKVAGGLIGITKHPCTVEVFPHFPRTCHQAYQWSLRDGNNFVTSSDAPPLPVTHSIHETCRIRTLEI